MQKIGTNNRDSQFHSSENLYIQENNLGEVYGEAGVFIAGDNAGLIDAKGKVTFTLGANLNEVVASEIKYRGMEMSRERLVQMERGSAHWHQGMVLRRDGKNTWILSDGRTVNKIHILKKDKRLYMKYLEADNQSSSGFGVVNVNNGGTVGVQAPFVQNTTLVVGGTVVGHWRSYRQ